MHRQQSTGSTEKGCDSQNMDKRRTAVNIGCICLIFLFIFGFYKCIQWDNTSRREQEEAKEQKELDEKAADEKAYQQAISVLYAVAYTLRMSYKTDHKIAGFFEYVVPPLEGFWWQENIHGVNYADKDSFNWISVIRLPDFVNQKDFEWAVETATKKKKIDCSSAEFVTIDEGLCVQIMHLGAFDDEPATVALMDAYLEQNGYVNDMNMERLHHEIYLSDARKVAPEKWKTVIRHPIKKL